MTPFTDAAPAAATEDNPRAKVGGNRPPIAAFYAEQNETLPAYLAEDNADIVGRVAELQAAFTRVPASVDTEDLAGKVADFIAQVGKCAKSAEAKRVDLKAGPLTAGRLIDGFFQKQVLEKLDAIKKPLTDRLTVFERAKAAEERKRREIAEAAAHAAAQEAAATAAKLEKEMRDAASLNDAVEAQERAKAAQEAAAKAAEDAAAKASEMSTVRGEYGSSSSLRTVWVARLESLDALDLNKLKDFMPLDGIQKALNAYVKIHKDKKPLAGVKFAEETTAVVRG